MNVERLIEIGPSPTLAGMAQRTLKSKYESYDQALGMQRQVLAYSKEGKEIYYNVDPPPPVEEEVAPASSSAPAPAAVATPAAEAAPAPAASAGPAAQIPDEPVKAVEIVHTVVAQKLKKTLEEVSVSKAIKDLVGGKSTMQVPISFLNIMLTSRMKFSVTCRKNSDPCPSILPKTSPSMNSQAQSNPPSTASSENTPPVSSLVSYRLNSREDSTSLKLAPTSLPDGVWGLVDQTVSCSSH